MQVLFRVEAELAAQRFFILEVTRKFRAQKIHHHGARHRGVLRFHAVCLQPRGGFPAPAGLHAFFGIAVHVEPRARLLVVREHLLPVQVDDFIAAADVVVNVAVDGLVVVHAAAYKHFRLFPCEIAQLFAVEQLANLAGIAAPLQLQLEQQVAFILAHGVLV